MHNETKGGICIKIEFNLQKNISLLQHGRRFFVYSSNMAAVMSCERTLYIRKKQTQQKRKQEISTEASASVCLLMATALRASSSLWHNRLEEEKG